VEGGRGPGGGEWRVGGAQEVVSGGWVGPRRW
jgi:hypothetical protein